MKLTKSNYSDYVALSIEGKLDSSSVLEFEKEINDILSNSSRLILDFDKLDYISSAGLRVILAAAKKIKTKDGKFAIISLKDYIKEIFDIVGFSSILPIFKTKEEIK